MNQGIAYANLHAYQEAAQSYVRALHLSPEAKYDCVSLSLTVMRLVRCLFPWNVFYSDDGKEVY